MTITAKFTDSEALPVPVRRSDLRDRVFAVLKPDSEDEEAYLKAVENSLSNYLAHARLRLPDGRIAAIGETFVLDYDKDDATDRALLKVFAEQFQRELEGKPLSDEELRAGVNRERAGEGGGIKASALRMARGRTG